MPVEFTMPKLGLTMEEGTIVEWLVADGEAVVDGSPVLVVQTDKVETEVSVSGSGHLRQIAAVGDTLACGAVVGLLLGTAADVEPSGRRFVSPNARRVATERGIDVGQVRGTGPGGRVVSEDVEAFVGSTPAPVRATAAEPMRPAAADAPVPATFAARSLADLLGVDIRTVPTEAGDRRITREDVARHVRNLLAPGAPLVASDAPPATQPPTTVVPLRGMRGTIARRMHRSLQAMAQLTLTMDADLDAVVADRTRRGDVGAAPGITDYVIGAVARALRDHPHVNAQITPDGVAHLPGIHIGLAVAVPDGLLVPVVRDADRRHLSELAAETTRLADAARDGALRLDDLDGGTFSVTALGRYGVDTFTPVINPPNVAILGIGRLRPELQLVDGELTTVQRATLSLTWDHRAFDGVPAAQFTRAVVDNLRRPPA